MEIVTRAVMGIRGFIFERNEVEASAAPKILIVDDTLPNLAVLSNMLRTGGYSVRPAPSGRFALRSAKNDPPDLILLDIKMPEMDGFEVCRRLKADERLREIPVLFISALAHTEDKVRAFEMGGLDYITKPFQPEEVMARVRTHLTLRRFGRELENRNRELQEALAALKSAEVQLVQSEKMVSLGTLTAGIAHELNNPINFICSGITGLKKLLQGIRKVVNRYGELTVENAAARIPEIEELKKEVEYDALVSGVDEILPGILEGTERAAQIVKGLRTFTRKDEEDRKAVSINDNIDATLMLLGSRYKDSIRIIKEYADLPMLLLFPGKFNQAVMNILLNAMDAVDEARETGMAEQGEIIIKTSRAERDMDEGSLRSYVAVTVSDNGIGIPEKMMGSIFEPFFTTKEVGKGVGLGLSITHSIVQDHGGFIEVRSREGEGTTLALYLPVKVSSAQA